MKIPADQGQASRQTAATNRYEQVVNRCAALSEQFQGDGRLAGDYVRVVIGVDENPVFFLRQFQGTPTGRIEIIAMDDYRSIQFFHGLYFDFRSNCGHDDHGVYAQMPGCQGNPLGVVTSRSTNDALAFFRRIQVE